MELHDIAPHQSRRQLQRLARGDDRAIAEHPSQDIEGIGQQVSGTPLVAVWPQDSQQPIAADGRTRRAGYERKQCNSSLL
jgi:hypothetical protein